MLWEIGEEGCEVRALRSRLGLDSGHASRLLRSLEAAGLVEVVPGAADRRARTARLTAGRARRARRARPAQRRARALVPRAADRGPARASRRGACATSSACSRRARRDPGGRPGPPGRPAVPPLLLRRARAPLRRALRPVDGLDRRAARDSGRRSGSSSIAYLRDAPIGCGALKHFAGGVRHQAHVGRRVGPRARDRPAAPRRARDARRRRTATARSAWRRTARSPRRSRCTAPPATSRCPPFNDEPFADHWFEKALGPCRRALVAGLDARRGAEADQDLGHRHGAALVLEVLQHGDHRPGRSWRCRSACARTPGPRPCGSGRRGGATGSRSCSTST